MLPRAALIAALLLVPGCTLPWERGGTGPINTSTPVIDPTPSGPPLVFGGRVIDALTNATLGEADVRIDLAQIRPCRNEGLLWQAWDVDVDADGRFGPFELPRPRSDDVAFFVHATRPGHSERVVYVGALEATRDLGNMTLALYPEAVVEGVAPAGTVVALEGDDDVRTLVADEAGRFRFDAARPVPSAFVAATDMPDSRSVTAPADIVVLEPNAAGWRLEGRLQLRSGAPVAANVLAWNGSMMVSAARAGDNGVFVLPLRAEAVEQLYVFARSQNGQYGATKVLEVQGPPGLRQTLIMEALC